ncbi:hypothetical protein Tco_1247373 [Tanacetum coccineum]
MDGEDVKKRGLCVLRFEDEDKDKDEIKGLIWINNHIANYGKKSGKKCGLWDCLGRSNGFEVCVEAIKSLVGVKKSKQVDLKNG